MPICKMTGRSGEERITYCVLNQLQSKPLIRQKSLLRDSQQGRVWNSTERARFDDGVQSPAGGGGNCWLEFLTFAPCHWAFLKPWISNRESSEAQIQCWLAPDSGCIKPFYTPPPEGMGCPWQVKKYVHWRVISQARAPATAKVW